MKRTLIAVSLFLALCSLLTAYSGWRLTVEITRLKNEVSDLKSKLARVKAGGVIHNEGRIDIRGNLNVK